MTCTHKKSAFLFVFLLLAAMMMPFAASAQEDPIQIFAQWTDDLGQPQAVPATLIPYEGYENSYWLQLPEGVTADRAALYIQDTSGMYSSFSVPNGTLLDIVLDAGIDLATAMPLEIMAFTTDGQPGPLFNLYVSAFPLPREPGAPVIMPARVTVRYLDSQTYQPVATETKTTVEGGTHDVYPEPRDLKPNYQLSGNGFVSVTVDEYGARPDVVDFYYDYVKAPVQPVDIIIRYRDIDTQQEIASPTSQQATEGQTTIQAAPYDLPANYQLEGSGSAVVTVTEYGADMPELTFYYRYVKPEVKPVTVTIYYVDESSWQQVASPTTQEVPEGTHAVYAAPYDLAANYTLSGAESQDVTVSENGASATEITFTYRYEKPEVKPVTVTIYYVDESSWQQVASPTTQEVPEGTHAVYAAPYDLAANYTLSSAESQDVTVSENGASATEITFTYRYEKPEVKPVTVTIYYVDESSWQQVASPTTQEVPEGTHAVYAAPYDLAANYTLSGAESQDVTVSENGASATEITFTYRYEKPEVKPVTVTIYYVDESSWQQVASPTTQEVPEGTHAVYAAPYDLAANYTLSGAESQDVTVSENGASATEITFTYRYEKPEVKPVTVTIYYVDESSWQQVASPTTQEVPEGTHAVYAAPYDLAANYTLSSAESQDVTVSENGASATEITFTYRYEKPEVKPVTVTIYYVDESSWQQVASPTTQEVPEGTHAVYAAPYDLAANYTLSGAESQDVTVSENGASATEITFTYRYEKPEVKPVQVPVLYLDLESGLPVASEQTVECRPGTTDVYANPQDLQPGYTLSSQSASMQQVQMDDQGYTNVSEVVFYYVFTPATPEPIQPQNITVSYYSKDGVQLADSTTYPCQPGDNYVTPGLDLGDKWQLISEESVYVLLDDNGLNPENVIFYYEETKEPTAERMPVTIRYADLNTNNLLRPEEKVYLPHGDHPITAPDSLDDTYVLDGENTRIVHVSEYGADPASVTFYYRTSIAAPKVALVTIRYVETTSGITFYSETKACTNTEENRITVNLGYVPQNEGETYLLTSADTVVVTVDENSVATPAEVVFEFQKIIEPTATPVPTHTPAPTPEMIRNVRVYFRTAEGMDVASSQEFPCYVGNNTIEATPVNLLPNFVLSGDRYQTVVLSPDGSLTPGEVVFLYVSNVTPAPSPFPYEYTPLDQWCYPNGNSINFRSEPYTTSRDTVIRTLKRSELCHITGELINGDGEEWYMIEVNGTKGFLKKTVVRVLSQAEVNALMGYTPVPATPSPTPIPENVAIDLWGRTNKKVFFRSSMEKLNNNKIAELKAGADVWVYHLDSIEGEQWYFVRVNGTDGYIMKEYVTLLSREESSLMPPPVPTASPIPTPYVPTPVPTLPPTATPVPTPVPTATPAPYFGYALTRYQVPLRTGATDEAVLGWLPSDSLVHVQYQTYVDSVSWSYVQDQYSQNVGYILTDALLPISNEAAIPYLQMIAQAKQTATPVPQQQTGYAETIGNNVPLRAFADTNGEILQLLPFKAVAYVRGQEYYDNHTWHLVNYSGTWGYVRADQMRMMTQQEVDAYQESLNKSTPLPTMAPATPAPITPESLSSWGYVTSTGKVNLREEASTDSKRLRLLDNYALALVLGTVTDKNGDTWYHVNQAGTDGYIMGKYFKVLTLSEVTDFLQSDEYKNANNPNTQTGTNTSGQLQPWEDYNQNVWDNPNMTHTYKPFVPPTATPRPNYEQLYTQSPLITHYPGYLPTYAPETTLFPGYIQVTDQPGFNIPTSTPGAMQPAEGEKTQDSNPLPVILAILGVAGVGGGVYAYSLHKKNERRRQAVRAQQARQAAARAQANQPQMRMAPNQMNQNTRAYQAPAAPFMPTGSGAPNAPAATTAYKPVSQQTGAYQPTAPQNQGTQAYQPPVQQPAKAPAAAVQQEMAKTTAYQPQNGNVPPVPAQNNQQPPRRRRSDKYNT